MKKNILFLFFFIITTNCLFSLENSFIFNKAVDLTIGIGITPAQYNFEIFNRKSKTWNSEPFSFDTAKGEYLGIKYIEIRHHNINFGVNVLNLAVSYFFHQSHSTGFSLSAGYIMTPNLLNNQPWAPLITHSLITKLSYRYKIAIKGKGVRIFSDLGIINNFSFLQFTNNERIIPLRPYFNNDSQYFETATYPDSHQSLGPCLNFGFQFIKKHFCFEISLSGGATFGWESYSNYLMNYSKMEYISAFAGLEVSFNY